MQQGDLVVYPQSDHTINIGQISGDYQYAPNASERYPHRRRVKWLHTELPRSLFTQGCLYELGSAMSVFTVKTHRDEVLEKVGLGEEIKSPEAMAADRETAPEDEPTAERISELTRDYILQTFNTDLKGHPFAQFCGWVLEALGYTAQVSRPGVEPGH